MSRITLILVVMVGTLTINSELMGQFRISNGPLRFSGRQLGIGWGAGYHSANPGPINHYYSPWSASNIHGLQRMPAPTVEPFEIEGSNDAAPQQPAQLQLPDPNAEPNKRVEPPFPDLFPAEQPNSDNYQGAIQPFDHSPTDLPGDSDWQMSSFGRPIPGLRPAN